MRSVAAAVVLFAIGVGELYGLPRLLGEPHESARATSLLASQKQPRVAAPTLELSELFAPGASLHPSNKALAFAGHRVRMVGFMAQMELAPLGAFYLTPRPVRCDEAGGGTADLPPQSVLVIANKRQGRDVAFVSGAIEVTGFFEVGNRADEQGRVSAFRVVLDDARETEIATNTKRAVK